MADDGTYLQTRFDEHGGRLDQLDSVSITYTRGNNTLTNLTARAVRARTEEMLEGAGILAVDRFDYIVKRADLGSFTEPLPGDRIKDITNDRTVEVTPAANEQCFRPITNRRKRLRVHTVLVAANVR